MASRNPQSGYTPCACRDCMEIAISSDVTKPELCSACEDTCGPENSTSSECQAEGAYGTDNESTLRAWLENNDPNGDYEDMDYADMVECYRQQEQGA